MNESQLNQLTAMLNRIRQNYTKETTHDGTTVKLESPMSDLSDEVETWFMFNQWGTLQDVLVVNPRFVAEREVKLLTERMVRMARVDASFEIEDIS